MARLSLSPCSVCMCSVLGLSVAFAATPPSSVRVPVLGYAVLREPLELRPLLGNAEGSLLGDGIPLPADASAMSIAPGQRYALIRSGDQGQVSITFVNPGGLQASGVIAGVMLQPERITFSSSGSSAILVSSALQHLQVVTGLPDAPVISLDADTSQFGATVAAAAVSDDSSVVLVALTNNASSWIARLATDGSLQTIVNTGASSSIRFFPHSHDAVAADIELNQITVLTAGAGDQYVARVLATSAQGVSTPLDVEFSTDGSRVYVANSGAKNILMLDVATGNAQAMPCGFAAMGFQRLTTSAISISGQDSRSVWVTDTDAPTPWVAYVPSLQ